MAVSSTHSSILWRQVWGLAAILAAVLISLMIYGFHQSSILMELGFTQFAATLGILQGLMGAVIEPSVGALSDRILNRFGSRLPQITVGVTLAGLLFVLIAILLPVNVPVGLRWLFPILMSFWLAAMITIRGPVVALLRQLAPTEELPIANGILILVLGIVGACGPLLDYGFKRLGAPFSFMLGAVLLVIGATLLYRTMPSHCVPNGAVVSSIVPIQRNYNRVLLLITLVGMSTALEINLLLSVFMPRLQTFIPQLEVAIISAIALLIAAITANPLGWLTRRWGAVTAMQVGLGTFVVLMAIALFPLNFPGAIALLLGFGTAFGLVFISMVPFALSFVPFHQTGLSTGLYFGGSSAGTVIFLLLKQLFNPMNIVNGIGVAAIALVVALICLQLCDS